eukprot:TRINITY_DN111607_c0_g1_i1.p2 TRINITY_DN111607_c0_g1~~TRINITY_DN111607_c0_g1_i1.p2  ORF type:complete len:194 (-),score=47.02 TRINITY_DN111607_c0_g1_i1:49-630(-)
MGCQVGTEKHESVRVQGTTIQDEDVGKLGAPESKVAPPSSMIPPKDGGYDSEKGLPGDPGLGASSSSGVVVQEKLRESKQRARPDVSLTLQDPQKPASASQDSPSNQVKSEEAAEKRRQAEREERLSLRKQAASGSSADVSQAYGQKEEKLQDPEWNMRMERAQALEAQRKMHAGSGSSSAAVEEKLHEGRRA